MADKDAKQTIDNNVQDAELLEKNKQDDAKVYRLIWIALVVVVLLSAVSIGWFYQQLQQQEADIQSSLTELSSQNGDWQSKLEQHRQQLGRLDSDQKQLAEKLQQLTDKQQLSNAELQKRWALQEVKYLLNVANQRAVLAHDVVGAIQALIMADKQLEALSDYRLHPLRAEIAEELMSLQSLTTLDIPGMAIQLQTLAAHVDKLRVKKGPEVDFSESPDTADIASTETPAWKQAISDIWQQLRSLVVIRHDQTGEAAVLAPEQRYFLYQNLRLQLESARLALLNADNNSFQHSLKTAITWLDQYFTGEERDAMLASLNSLAEQKIDVSIPDISGSLNWLEEYQQ
ncbi:MULTISPECIES: uroporphyrinogen-III C-methyltransferase [Methylophaga]|uniref:YjgF-like protein n=1 Tax=Methylophaga aminisulfidivorans MP TaxID=1026882 RepID=F5SYB1_9GAMM|nr:MULTISPECIES: uroporphyrinogen-III C-methyltransferase [Methylophaga]EGL54156.1 yjgF-like protein [Methylophaga aminisulfidivorans MP]WVI85347.1 uroporphyrinogen-III C-methyltransferase [Methylophaga thalassica]